MSSVAGAPRRAASEAGAAADTIRTLTARLGEVKTALEGVRQDNQSLRDKQADLERDVRVARWPGLCGR